MQNSTLADRRAVLIGTVVLISATAACSRGELSAAEREKQAQSPAPAESGAAVRQTSIPADSSGLIEASLPQSQTKAPAGIEDILKATPLRNPKADCATPVAGTPQATEFGTQCPTDPPAKK
jgi:hypothetical protein